MGKGMRAGKKPAQGGAGGASMQKQLQQMQQMQQRMEAVQEELESREYEATAGGGAITVKANGRKELTSVTLKPEIVDPQDVEMLQDLIVACVNEVIRQADEDSRLEMDKLTGGLSIPGLL